MKYGMWTTTMALLLAAGTSLHAAEVSTVWLDELDLGKMKQGWGTAQTNRSIRETTLSLDGKKFERGVGTHANSSVYIDLGGGSDRFLASVGLDDAANGPGSTTFTVVGDGKTLFESGVMKQGNTPKPVDLDVKGIKILELLVDDAGDGINFDHGDWADARFVVSGAKPKTIDAPPIPPEEPVILTPRPGPAPRINGPKIYGCRPGNPFIYRIPTTGERPIAFTAEGLPASLKLDQATGIITGNAPERGEYKVTFRAQNPHGRAERLFKIVAGDKLSLTPQMGFNDWYAYYNRVTDAQMREAADIMVLSGMADAGYQYVNIDDCWMGKRDAEGNITGNEKFPDMAALAAYIHSKGLKAGLYTSPGPKTCAGYTGTWQYEAQDAKRFADWGFDFLKYDWCSYSRVAPRPDLAAMQKPYRLMGDLLKQQKRDMVFNLCQYGMGEVWKWGGEVGGHSWRTGGDLGFELSRIFEIALKNCAIREYNKPGEWNDPDYIQIGWIGDARKMGQPKVAPLTPTEQYSFMSLWCLMASPLFYSGDMSKLDEFTLNILCNTEVIEVDQDPLGQCARVVGKPGKTFVLAKDLEDGSKAIGLCNRDRAETTVAVTWADVGLSGKQRVRDLWQQKDLGAFDEKFETKVPRHGVVLVRVQQ
jgi:alpha-galactosidase